MYIAICDDDEEVIKQVTEHIDRFAETYSDIRYKAFSSAEAVIEYYSQYGNKFDVLITDIELEAVNGVELASRIRNMDENIAIFFLTYHTEYAIKCFKPRPVDFWIKPLSYEVLEEGLCKVLRLLRKNNEYITVYSDRRSVRIKCSDILYIERQSRKTTVYTVDSEYCTNRSLSDFLNELDNKRFVRIYQSHIINIAKVRHIDNNKLKLYGSEYDFDIGRRFINDLKKRYVMYKEECAL